MQCPQCHAEVPDQARFCPSCGHELVVVGDQRRIATVLFADLVGFTALSERLDPEQVKALVDRCFERFAVDIEAFGGRVDKVIGDAIVALYGAPIAHEDDAERAVRAGLRMQQTIAELAAEVGHEVAIRVGINTGEVLVGTVSAGREYTAMGDVVNTAARLQTAAEPGMVLVGPDTYAATNSAVAYDAIEPVVAKGKQLPVMAWIAREAIVPPGHRLRREQVPLIGRESERNLLTSVAATAIDRSRAALLLIHGEAGMGKSRLAEETTDYARDELGAVVLEGRCVPYGEANVWWPIADAVRFACGIEPDATVADIDVAFRKVLGKVLQASNRLDETDRIVDGLHHLLGHDGALRGIDAARARDEVIRSVVAMAEGFTHTESVIVVLSDLHWAEQEVLDLVDTLLSRLARRPFVFIATARRSLRERWNPAPEAANTVVLHLDPLGEEASRALVQSLTVKELHPALVAMVVDRAGGNPFYLEELISLVSEAGVETLDQLLATEAGELPSTLRGLVAARLDALPPVDRSILDDAAVLGRSNKIMALAMMVHVKRGLDTEITRAHIENLAAREFFILNGDSYSFRSDVIREVAYSTLTKADRARAHAGIAVWIEEYGEAKLDDDGQDDHAHVLANHYAAAAELTADLGRVGGVPADVADRAIAWLLRASADATHATQPAVVATLTDRALGLMTATDERRSSALRALASARTEQYDLDGAMVAVEEAIALAEAADDARGMAKAHLVHGEILRHRGLTADALACLETARAGFEELGDDRGAADSLRQIGMVHLFANDFVVADEVLHQALARYERLGDARGVAWAHQNLSWSAYSAGHVDEADARIGLAMATFEELGDPGGLTWSRGLQAWVRFHQGRTDEATALAAEVGADAHARGEIWGEAMMVVLTGSIDLWSGRTLDAVATLERAVRLFDSIEDRFGGLQARGGLARGRIMSGDVAGGRHELETAMAQANQGVSNQRWFTSLASLAAAVQMGDVDMGRRALGGVDEITDDRADLGGTDLVVGLAMYALQAGDVARARATIDRATESRGYVDAARALIAAVEGNPEAALVHAAAVVGHPHTYLDATAADIARALAYVVLGRVAEARDVIGEAIERTDNTDDLVAQATVRLADAAVTEATNGPGPDFIRSAAETRLAHLGIDATGWRVIINQALASVSA